MEFDSNTGKCFISDATLAENFGVSTKTISRAVSNLEAKGFIKRETKNIKGGRERIMLPVIAAIEKALTTDKMTIDSNLESAQRTKCPLTTDKMTLDKGQNDFIKDNLIDKEKDNKGVLLCKHSKTETAQGGSFIANQKVEGREPQVMTSKEAMQMYGLTACANRVAAGIKGCYWIDGDLVKIV